MGKNILNEIAKWHEDDEHEKIIETIRALPKNAWTYELVCLLARAENNMDNYEEAERLLLSVKDEGVDDKLWYYRLGYAYFYQDKNEEALAVLEKRCEFDLDDEDALYFLAWLYDHMKIEPKVKIPQEIWDRMIEHKSRNAPQMYDEEQAKCVEEHITKYFGEFPNIFQEVVSTDLHIDICVIPPDNNREFYTLVTMGAGAYSMDIPEDLADKKLNRMELVICLPTDWNVQGEDEKDYWPIRLLKTLARFPKAQNTWFGWGHSIGNGGKSVAENADFTGAMLITPLAFDEDASTCVLPDDDEVNFYQVLPIYEEEMNFKTKNDASALLNKMKDTIPFEDASILNINRLNVCRTIN